MAQATNVINIASQVLQNAQQQQQDAARNSSQGLMLELPTVSALRTQPQGQESQARTTGELSIKAITKLFERMTYIYAHKWSSVMGDATDAKGELTTAAKTWQAGLMGITPQQLGKGLERAALSGQAWNPSLPEFRALCEHRDDVPSIDQVINIIANSVPMQGSIAKRYKHPLVLAVAKSDGFDAWLFKTATTKQCTDMVKPIYTRLVQCGWDDFLPEHYEEQKAIAKPLKQTSGFGLAALSSLKANLGLVNDLPEKTITATDEEIKREIMARDPDAQARKQKMLMEAKKKMEESANV